MELQSSFYMQGQPAQEVEHQSNGHLSMARNAWMQGDFDTARMAYQKCAYISGRLSGDDPPGHQVEP